MTNVVDNAVEGVPMWHMFRVLQKDTLELGTTQAARCHHSFQRTVVSVSLYQLLSVPRTATAAGKAFCEWLLQRKVLSPASLGQVLLMHVA
jgi:hypothetical protein